MRHIYDVFRFDKNIPRSSQHSAISFYSKTVKTFAFAMLNNKDKENNAAYDFSIFCHDIKLQGDAFINMKVPIFRSLALSNGKENEDINTRRS